MSNLIYDEDWLLTCSNASPTDLGVFTGNGKIGVHVSMKDISVEKTLISAANVQFDQVGKYRNNTLDAFDVNNIKLINNDSEGVTYAFKHQSLDMHTGSVNTSFEVTSGAVTLDVNNIITPLRQFPYCILHTLEITPASNVQSLDMFHEIKAPLRTSMIDYDNSTMNNENMYQESKLYVFYATGTSETRQCKIVAASCYLFESSVADKVDLGFNIAIDRSYAFQKWRLKNLVGGTTYKLHILSTIMTSLDFTESLQESRRILLNVAFKSNQVDTLIPILLDENSQLWAEMWTADVEIMPKMVISASERGTVMKCRKYVRLSLFNMYACLRSAVNTEINPLNLSYIDTNGNIYFDGDLWLIPTLIFIKPQIARIMLEFKYMLLSQALQLAASFGYRGSKFPYKNDIIGYKNVYWDTISPLHIFNNATICINIWNYFRVTQDRDWLQQKGYQMMRNIADFLAYYAKIVQDKTQIPKTLGLGEVITDNNAFTMNVTSLALRYTIEASNVLNVIPNARWGQILLRLAVPTITYGNDIDVILYSSEYDGSTQVDILDNLITLLPYYSTIYFGTIFGRNASSIKRHLDYYSTRMKPAYQENVLNRLIRTALLGTLAQTNVQEMPLFYSKLLEIMDENFVGTWGLMNISNNPAIGNDISLNSFIVLIMITCLCRLNIRGSTAPSNIVVETYKIEDSLGTNMPNTWSSIRIGSVGPMEVFTEVANQVPYSS